MAESTRDIEAHLRGQVVPEGAARHGLVVGIEEYRDRRLNLRCARADAQIIYDLMVDPDCGMFPPDNVRLLVDGEATRQNIWRALAALHRSAGEDDTVWIYYAGHAAPEDKSVYWVTHDSDVDDLYGTGLSNDQIAGVLNDIRVRRLVVILDCCHAAATSIQKNPTRALPTAEEVFASYQGEGRVTLSSSDGKEKSVELSDVGHGAFTYFLHKGLRGEADTDGDGVVTADELWTYLHRKVAEASRKVGNPQTPMLLGKMSHEFPLSLNPTAAGRKKQIAQAIESLIGLGDDRLSTGEARFCLELLRDGPKTQAEEEVWRLLDAAPDTMPEARLLKVLIAAAQHSAAAGPPPARPEPPGAQASEPVAAEELPVFDEINAAGGGDAAPREAEFLVEQEPEQGPWYGPRVDVPPLHEEEAAGPARRPVPARGGFRRFLKVLVAFAIALGVMGAVILGIALAVEYGLFGGGTHSGGSHTSGSGVTEKPWSDGGTPWEDGGKPELPVQPSPGETARAQVAQRRREVLDEMADGLARIGVLRVYVTRVDFRMVAHLMNFNQAFAIQQALVPELSAVLGKRGIALVQGVAPPRMFQPGDTMAAFFINSYIHGPLGSQAAMRIQFLQPAFPTNRLLWTTDIVHIEPSGGR